MHKDVIDRALQSNRCGMIFLAKSALARALQPAINVNPARVEALIFCERFFHGQP